MSKFGLRVAFGLMAGLVFTASTASAAVLYDDWNEASCGRTNQAGVIFHGRARIDAIKLWYSWAQNESHAHYWILSNGATIGEGTLTRGDCHESMPSWCDADARVDMVVPRGLVDVRVRGDYLCQNPGSQRNGFMKVFGTMQ